MSRSTKLLILAALALVAGAAPAQAASPFAPLDAALRSGKPQLGKRAFNDLDRRVDRAQLAYRQGRWCASIKAMSGVVTSTKRLQGAKRVRAGAKLASRTRTLQRRTFLKRAAGKGSCGLPKPKVSVSAKVKPTRTSLPKAADGHARDVVAIEGRHASTDFVADELLVVSDDQAKVQAFVKRWDGKVLERKTTSTAADTWLVRVNTRKVKTHDLSNDLRRLDPLARGSMRASDSDALRLVALAADAAAHGMKVGPNFLVEADAVEDRTTLEAFSSAASWSPNAFNRWYNDPSKRIRAGEAWRTLRLAGLHTNRVKLAIVDGGFGPAPADLAGTSGDWGSGANQMSCGSGGCPWHGTNVASAAAGVIDNGLGVAGSGGQVADVMAVSAGVGDTWDIIDGIYEAFEADAKIMNISLSYELDALVSEFNIPIEDATQEAQEQGTLVISSAGNDGRDVDAEDCFVACWEEEWIAPCENQAVVCVGGISDNSGWRHADSNYGYEWTEDAGTSDVDIFAPFTTWVGPDPDNGDVREVSGTSFSGPFVAGVAAIMAAARPSITPQQLEEGLKSQAGTGPDKNVSRIVNAMGSLMYALDGTPVPPMVRIEPHAETVPYSGFHSVRLKAKSWTTGFEDACCSFAWTSDKDGVLGGGRTIDAIFQSPGVHTVTVTATDDYGNSSSATTTVDAQNLGPTLGVSKPAPNEQLIRTQTYKFDATATDPNEFGGIPCSSIRWDIVNYGLPNTDATGCKPEFTFAVNGTRTLKVYVKDAQDAGDTVTRSFTVANPPPNSPPLVAIVSPDGGASLDPHVSHTLKATAIDPDNAGPVTGTWSVKVGSGAPVQIGTGNQISWKPADHVPSSCGGDPITLTFSATDPHGTSTDEIAAYVPYPVC